MYYKINLDKYISGGVSGIFQSISGHPFDTLKIYKQNSMCTRGLYRSGLYRGIIPSIYGSMSQNSFIYGTAGSLNTGNEWENGFVTGILCGIFITPYENRKIAQQVGNLNYNFYRGMSVTCLRDSLGFSLYFGFYDILSSSSDDSNFSIIINGGITGCISWLFTYPIDVINSRYKSNYMLSIKDCIHHGNLTKGLSYCLLRSVIVNSIGWFSYEKMLNILNKK